MPPRGFRISWALDEPALGFDLLGEIAEHAHRADDLPGCVEDTAHR